MTLNQLFTPITSELVDLHDIINKLDKQTTVREFDSH